MSLTNFYLFVWATVLWWHTAKEIVWCQCVMTTPLFNVYSIVCQHLSHQIENHIEDQDHDFSSTSECPVLINAFTIKLQVDRNFPKGKVHIKYALVILSHPNTMRELLSIGTKWVLTKQLCNLCLYFSISINSLFYSINVFKSSYTHVGWLWLLSLSHWLSVECAQSPNLYVFYENPASREEEMCVAKGL